MPSRMFHDRRRKFHDRRDAGRRLAERLGAFADQQPVVLALPRGGVPVGFEVAQSLRAPLDVLVVRKIGAPGNPELGIGAVAEGITRYFNEDTLRMLQVSPEDLGHAVERAERELRARLQRYRGERPALDVAGRTVIVVDDGLATGGTARAAARCLRERGPARLMLAVPVGAAESIEALQSEYDDVVCLSAPDAMRAIGYWYQDFGQTSDDEVTALLAKAEGTATSSRNPARSRLSSSSQPTGSPATSCRQQPQHTERDPLTRGTAASKEPPGG